MMAFRDEAQHFVECDLCQQPVSFFCRQCGVNLCDPCVPIHLRVKSKNGHDIVDYTSKDNDDTCHCDSHPQNDCSAYCKTCDAPICMLCVSMKHKSHKISELSDKIEDLLKVIAKENDRLQSSKHELERILDHTMKMLSSISSIYKQRKDEVTARGEEWHKQIEETVKKLHQELDDMQREHEAVLQKQKKEFEEMIDKVNRVNSKTRKLQKSKNFKEMQTFIPMIQKYKNLSEVSQYSFPKSFERKIDEYLEIKLKKKESSDRKILDVPTVTSVIDTGFPADEETKNRLYDMAVTDDNKVWMGGESRELKLFDLQGHLHRTVSITYRGIYLCMFNKPVVYSEPLNKAVRMISNTDTVVTMFTTRDWIPLGVTSAASGDLLVCLVKDDQNKVVRYSSTGTVLQEIQYDSQCQPLYKDATYITENVNGDIIVTDWVKKAVIAVDRLGIFRYTYSEKDSNFKPSSVATDFVGHVIVTEFSRNKIHLLDRDGRFLRYIIPKGGIKNPRGVCILGDGEMMVGECVTGIAKRIKYLEE
ncbi:E3 ubiquitin-protein ligase TRIM36-like [Crassostrea angulata]|uniref:E3 ubiquitin-protein ligase TRIM36-like n=1 Tax=Magallana angulata TaxID=2784310 RepID=UPI0022B1A78F|nr:E3 ubiquitin-protein ligase TRIM36-like [Crassostrea angulata]XP_052697170.1 E3 ubiquitin-protein ligase TRIM36-like [Crassostrea angulata]XP_052697172.1 E3 ubiquitin-protein ligase TRIM36-like [Crassostrea angulata]